MQGSTLRGCQVIAAGSLDLGMAKELGMSHTRRPHPPSPPREKKKERKSESASLRYRFRGVLVGVQGLGLRIRGGKPKF